MSAVPPDGARCAHGKRHGKHYTQRRRSMIKSANEHSVHSRHEGCVVRKRKHAGAEDISPRAAPPCAFQKDAYRLERAQRQPRRATWQEASRRRFTRHQLPQAGVERLSLNTGLFEVEQPARARARRLRPMSAHDTLILMRHRRHIPTRRCCADMILAVRPIFVLSLRIAAVRRKDAGGGVRKDVTAQCAGEKECDDTMLFLPAMNHADRRRG